MRVFEDREFAKDDILANPPKEVYKEWQVYKIELKRLNKEMDLLVENVREYDDVYEIFGMFLDEDQWFNVRIHLWKNPDMDSYVRVVPWPNSPISRREAVYRDSVSLLVT